MRRSGTGRLSSAWATSLPAYKLLVSTDPSPFESQLLTRLALPAMVSTYAVDSYKPVAGSLFVAITVNKNVWGYGFSKFIVSTSDDLSRDTLSHVKPIMGDF